MDNQEALTALMETLKKRTYQYAIENGVKPEQNGFVKCLDPNHKDNNPSCSWWEEGGVFHCFSCGKTFDIFTLANIFENKPLNGRQFIEENVFHLAARYGEPYEHLKREMTPEEIEKSVKYRTMQMFMEYVIQNGNEEYLNLRKITKETAKALGIGSVPSYEAVANHLISFGANFDVLNEIGIDAFKINESKLIMVIKDEYGRPCSFTARDMFWTKEKGGPKYINGNASSIFNKSRIFYGWSDIKKQFNPMSPLVICEGYLDFVTAYQKGYRDIIALGSASFTDDHIEIIERDKKIRAVSIALDQDKVGKDRTSKILERLKNKVTNKKYLFACYKESGKDLDEILNSHEGTVSLKTIFDLKTMFDYEIMAIKEKEENLDESLLFDNFVTIISKTERPKEREEQARILASYLTQYTYQTILKEVDYIVDGNRHFYALEVKKYADSANKEIINSPENALQIIEALSDDIKDVNKKFEKTGDNIFERALVNFSRYEEEKTDETKFKIDFRIPWLDALNIFPGKTVIIGGQPNRGKTSIYQLITMNILIYNSNVTLFYASTDDSAEKLYAGLISTITGLNREYCENPYFHEKFGLNNNDSEYAKSLYEKYINGKEKIESYIKTKKLIILDVKNSVDDWRGFEKAVKDIALDYDVEKRFKIMIVDSANKISAPGNMDENATVAFLSSNLKKISERHKFLTFENFEMNKSKANEKLSLNKLSGSKRMQYDCDVGAILYNPTRDLIQNGGTELTWNWKAPNGQIYNFPVLVTIMEKTKCGANTLANAPLFYQLNTITNTMEPIKIDSREHNYYLQIWNLEWENKYRSF